MSEKMSDVIRYAVQLVLSRGGDIDTDDGSFATVDTDLIIRLEGSISKAFDLPFDDVSSNDVALIGAKIDSNQELMEELSKRVGSYGATIANQPAEIEETKELIAKQAEQIELMTKTLRKTRDRLDMLDEDAMGTARIHGVQPWSIRDETIDDITKALAATAKG